MKRQVWKYKLSLGGVTEIALPEDAKPLFVAEQSEQVCLWVSRDEAHRGRTVIRKFRCVGTGFPEIHQSDVYIGTVLLVSGSMVLHIFETF